MRCPECAKRIKAERSRKYFDQIKVSGKYTEDKAELLKMYYIMRTCKKKIDFILDQAVVVENKPQLKRTAKLMEIFLKSYEKTLSDSPYKSK